MGGASRVSRAPFLGFAALANIPDSVCSVSEALDASRQMPQQSCAQLFRNARTSGTGHTMTDAQRDARPTTALSSTFTPGTVCSTSANSLLLCVMPSRHGVKIIAVGATLLM